MQRIGPVGIKNLNLPPLGGQYLQNCRDCDGGDITDEDDDDKLDTGQCR